MVIKYNKYLENIKIGLNISYFWKKGHKILNDYILVTLMTLPDHFELHFNMYHGYTSTQYIITLSNWV